MMASGLGVEGEKGSNRRRSWPTSAAGTLASRDNEKNDNTQLLLVFRAEYRLHLLGVGEKPIKKKGNLHGIIHMSRLF